eukprot:g1656.t1
MPGEPPGGRLLQRSPLEFVDFQVSSECSGLVSVLLTSTSQTLFMCLGTGVANILYLVANIVLSPAAPAAYDLLKWPLALPAMMVDLAFQFLYAILVVMKVSMLVSGWKSRPAVWFEVQEQLLIWAAEMLTLLCNLRLSGLLALAGYFTGDHLCRTKRSTCLGINSLLVIEWPLLGRKPDIWSLTGFMMRANSPAQILRTRRNPNVVASSLIYQALGLVSALVNLVTIVLILKAAFLDARWVPDGGVRLLCAAVELVTSFQQAWDEVHRDDRWARFLPLSSVRTSARSEVSTARRRKFTPRRSFP